MKICPYCNKENNDSELKCICGYYFDKSAYRCEIETVNQNKYDKPSLSTMDNILKILILIGTAQVYNVLKEILTFGSIKTYTFFVLIPVSIFYSLISLVVGIAYCYLSKKKLVWKIIFKSALISLLIFIAINLLL